MIRLFVGLELPDDIKDQVYTLRGGVPMARWVDKEKLHLNLRFWEMFKRIRLKTFMINFAS